jgi:hypothetical protein
MQFDIPVLFIFFNRPSVTRLSFEQIKAKRPKVLFLCSDGGRDPIEHDLVCSLRNELLSYIDWECTLQTKFENVNHGCKKNVSDAVLWFFDKVDKGIVIEDDIVVTETFFDFMRNCLEHFKDNENIQMISGYNHGLSSKFENDLELLPYPIVWSWASWKDRMVDYRANIKPEDLDLLKNLQITENRRVHTYLLRLFQMISQGKLDTWDYQLLIPMLKHNRKTVIPRNPLMQNLGFGKLATHTKYIMRQDSIILDWAPKDFSLPSEVNKKLQRKVEDRFYDGSLIEKIKRKIYNVIQ